MTFVGLVIIVVGAFFVLVAAIGLVRFPDLPTRIHAAAKAGAFGTGLILLGVAVSAGDWGIAIRCLAAAIFLFLTAPVAAHAVARAAFRGGDAAFWTLDECPDWEVDRCSSS
ncbi:MAG: multicomponent Na+:H+ antiporter subunit G [Myxococcota bacterium]|jgi:multicomponent Na+:H+ antiporter subunit G